MPKRVHPPCECNTSKGPLQHVKLLGPNIKQVDVFKASQWRGHWPRNFIIINEWSRQNSRCKIHKSVYFNICKSLVQIKILNDNILKLNKFRLVTFNGEGNNDGVKREVFIFNTKALIKTFIDIRPT